MKIRRQSELHDIVVTERGGVRTLRFGDTIQSTMRVGADGDDGGLEYVQFFHLPFILQRSIERVLFIGLGGATGPRQFLRDYPGLFIDVVEIDGEVIRVAEEWFHFAATERCEIHEADGSSFLEAEEREWDLIIVDAYSTEGDDLVVPVELTTKEFFALCRSRLAPRGIVVFNCAAPPENRLTRTVRASLSQSFSSIVTFRISNAKNVVMLASNELIEESGERLASMAREALERGVVKLETLPRRCRQLVPPKR